MRSIPAAMVTSFDLAFVECSTPARLADWYDTFTASGRQMSSTEFSFLVDHVSGLRALEKMAQTEMLSSPSGWQTCSTRAKARVTQVRDKVHLTTGHVAKPLAKLFGCSALSCGACE